MNLFVYWMEIITFILLMQLVESQCISYYDYPNFIEGEVETQTHHIDLQSEQLIGIGFWISYRPQSNDNIPQNPEVIDIATLKQLFIFSLQQIDTDNFSLFLYSEISLEDQKVTHIMILQTINGNEMLTQPLDYDSYEGSWFFIYCFIDQIQQSISLNHYNLQSRQLISQVLNEYLLLHESMQSITGGYKNIMIDKTQVLHLQAYPGYIESVILEFSDYFLENINYFLGGCLPQYPCNSQKKNIVSYNSQLTGNIIQKELKITLSSYIIQGWIKQDILFDQLKTETVLLRISRNSYYSNDDQIGDKILYVTYYQDAINSQLNGFSLQTYSYQYIWKSNIYNPQVTDTIIILDQKYMNLLTSWHYFQFEFGTLSNNGQPIYTVYYALTDLIEQYKWSKQINHFTSQNLFFSIGGDTYSNTPFMGYLSDWVYTQLCELREVSFMPKCHYSCQSCKGITSQDCTSCNEDSNRVFLSNTCRCKFGYVDTQGIAQCLEYYQYKGSFRMMEKQLQIYEQGYYLNDQCDFGYFKQNNTCIKCPYQVEENLIRCADCILYPDIFSEKLNCTFQFNSLDENSVFHYQKYSTQEQELYEITLTIQQKYQIQINTGFSDNYICKEGYFLSDNNKCQQCIDNCLECNDAYFCNQCQERYNYVNGACIECQYCAYKKIEYFNDILTERIYCPNKMYLKQEFCFNCGNYCQDCSEKSCYYCEDKSRYFITLDSINCALCYIKNCQYCFQYYIKSDKTIVTSLDIDNKSEKNYHEIQTGCALCNNNYFFSFITMKCEPKPQDMSDCESGVIIDNMGSSKCLISSYRLDAVQQSQCIDKHCLQCINNYSLHLPSFCIICENGYYSSFLNGKCIYCPTNCKTCAEYNQYENDLWKWDIKAFYKFFLNQNNDHTFETHQVSSLKVICLSCHNNFQLIYNTCAKACDENCQDCQIYEHPKNKFQFQCNKCNLQTFNSQRSVDQNAISQCFTCPDYCSACVARSPQEITALNPFFNQTSSYLKYSHICYQPQLINQEGTVSIQPKYLVPNICQKYEKCEKIFEVHFQAYCDYWAWQEQYDNEPNEFLKSKYLVFQNMFGESFFQSSFTTELFDSLNQARITEIYFVIDIILFEDSYRQCEFYGNPTNFTTYSKYNVFTLRKIHLTFRNSEQSYYSILPIFIQASIIIFNFNTILFEGIQFYLFQEYDYHLFNLTFINDFDPITLKFDYCELFQNLMEYGQVNFISTSTEKLLISRFTMQSLLIQNSTLFNIQSSSTYSQQMIEQLNIENSHFINTSIFFYYAEQDQLNQILNFTNVTILNNVFSNSFFINSSILFDKTLGEIYLQNFYLENLIFQNSSIFFHIPTAIHIRATNFSLKNITFLDQSSFIVCNILKIQGLTILDSLIYEGYLINIHSQSAIKRYEYMIKEITISDIKFVNNSYSQKSINSFIHILQDEFTKYNFTCNSLQLDNNTLANSNLGISSFSYVSYKYSLIYIECKDCLFRNIKIYRGIGLPEISIINSDQLKIQNLHIETGKQYYKRSLHSTFECSKKFIYNDMPFALYIWSYSNVQIDDAIIQNTMALNYQILLLFGKSRTEIIQNESISISNSVFKNNLLLTTDGHKQSSIISIETQQISTISLESLEFQNNFLNQYYQNTILHSSSTLLINAEQGLVNFQSLLFKNNIITNSSDSVFYVLSKRLSIQNCYFMNQNILNHDLLLKNIIVSKESILKDLFAQSFQILSLGGNGYIETNYFLMKNTSIKNSLAQHGGGFYITTRAEGVIFISNSSFVNTSTVLSVNQLASGGLFYIDSSQSILNLTLTNCQIQSSYARTYGGAIFIEPSRTSNFIYLESSVVYSVFSIQHSFLSFSAKKEITIFSNIIINNSKFENPVEEFEKFIVQLIDLQQQSIVLFQTENPLIYIQYSNLNMNNCYFHNIHLAYLLEIQQGFSVSLQELNILNCTLFQSPIIKVNLRSGNQLFITLDIEGIIYFQHLLISNIYEYASSLFQCNQPSTEQFDLLCPFQYSDINDQPQLSQKQTQVDLSLNCNLNFIYQIIQRQDFSVIQISDLKNNHFIYMNHLTVTEITCDSCKYGVLSIQEIESQLNLKTENIKFINNSCGIFGCISAIKSKNDIRLSSDQVLKIADQSSVSIIFNTTVSNSIFINNTATYGGACFLSQIDVLIKNSQFFKNTATKYGGAIYYDSQSTTLLTLNSWFVQNNALIGGAIYFYNQQLQRIQNLNLVIENNEGFSFANNLFESPRFLYLSLDQATTLKNRKLFSNSTTIIEYIQFVDKNQNFNNEIMFFPSGISFTNYNYFDYKTNSYISLNHSLRLQAQNIFCEKIANLENTECSISAQTINKSKPIDYNNFTNHDSNQFVSKSNFVFNMETGDYNFDDLIVYFNPYQDKSLQLQLAFQCNSIQIPFYNNSTNILQNVITNYILLLNLQTYECQVGEYYNKTSKGCVLCDITQRQYSVIINATQCNYRDETKIFDIKPAMIKLKPTFWRSYYYSDIIQICHNLLANCEGGWTAGDLSCAQGHIGALCEQCDLYNIKGQGEYSQNQSYQCSSCDQSASNLLNIILVIFWTLISVLITVNSTIQMIDDFVFRLKLKPLGFISTMQPASTSALLKVFTNYLQIVSSVASFQLAIPIGIILAVRGVGNPVGSVAFSLDCYLKSINNIPIIYFRIIWGFAMAGMYMFLFFLFHILSIVLQKKQFNITFVTTTFIYIYIYLSPNMVSDLSFLISYRNISGERWIAANVAYLYNTQIHKNWLIYFVTPTFLVIGILLPLFFWYIVHHHRYQLDSKKTKKMWGYLYNEYKQSTYYWETIKIIQKELIILILIYYEDYVAIKACLIFFLLHLYSKLTAKFKPYLTENLNKLDSLSTSICKISIVLAQSIYLAQELNIQEIIWPFYGVLCYINFYFIFEMISKLILAYFNKLYEHIDKIRLLASLYIPFQFRNNKFCMRILQNRTEQKYVIKKRFQKLRKYLVHQAKLIIELKSKNHLGLHCKENINNSKYIQQLGNQFQTSPTLKLCGIETY